MGWELEKNVNKNGWVRAVKIVQWKNIYKLWVF